MFRISQRFHCFRIFRSLHRLHMLHMFHRLLVKTAAAIVSLEPDRASARPVCKTQAGSSIEAHEN